MDFLSISYTQSDHLASASKNLWKWWMNMLNKADCKDEIIASKSFRACMAFNISEPGGFWFFHACGTNADGIDFETTARIGDKKPSRKMFYAWARYAKILLTQHANT